MKQQLKQLMLTALVALCSITTFAHDFEVDGIYYNYNDDGVSVSVTCQCDDYWNDTDRYTGAVIIPSSVTYNGQTYSVTSIGKSAFYDCSGLTSVTIGNSVTTIEDRAFSGCSGLTSVTIPNSVTSIGDKAFRECSGLISVTIPNSVTSIGGSAFDGTALYKDEGNWDKGVLYIDGCLIEAKTSISGSFAVKDGTRVIADYAFEYCGGLTSITIPNSVASIGDAAFYNCSGLTSVTIPNSVTSIGRSAFDGCSGLTLVTIPNSVTSIGGSAFDGTALYKDEGNWDKGVLYIDGCLIKAKEFVGGSYILKDGTSVIADYAFKGCGGLTSITIPNSVTSIGRSAFNNCSGLTSVTIPGTVKVLEESLFDGCTNLTNVTISEGVEVLTSGVFMDCCNLESIYLPSTLRSIEGWGSFVRCYKLASILVSPYNSHFYSTGTVLYSKDGHKLVACACTLEGEFEIPNHVQQIASGAFRNCKLTRVVIPEGVTIIDMVTFSECYALKEVVIPNTVTRIRAMAFYECRSLESIVIPPSVTKIDNKADNGMIYTLRAFYGCVNLKTVYNLSNLDIVAGSEDYEYIAYYADAVYTGLPETIKLTVSAAEYATLILPFDAEVPQGIKAYTCDVVRGSTLLLTEADKLEAYTPYIVYGYNVADADGECLVRGELGVMNNTYSFTGAPTRREKQFEVGQLVGTLEDIYAPQGSYVLQSQDGVVGFYRVAADNSITVKANRAYLKAQASGIRAFTFSFADDDETAINPVVAAERDAETYSLSGVRVGKDYKGIVIRDGKKFLNR